MTDHRMYNANLTIDLCDTGFQLHGLWLDALKTGDLELIYQTMYQYFTHRNGIGERTPCMKCGYGGER